MKMLFLQQNRVMQLSNRSIHFTEVNVRISRRSFNVGVSKKLLHNANICASFARKCAKGVAAAMRRQTPHVRFCFPQVTKELVIIAGKIPWVQQRSVFRAKQELTFM